MASRNGVIVLAPNSFGRFLDSSLESQFQVLLHGGQLASLQNLDTLLNSPLAKPRLSQGLKSVNPMAGYYLESFLKRAGYDAHTVFDWEDDAGLEAALASDPVAVALSTTYITDPNLLRACLATLRRTVGDLPVVVGGPYIWKQKLELDRDRVSATERRAMQELGADLLADCLFAGPGDPELRQAIYVAHEFGEYTLLRLLEKLADGKRQPEQLADVPNLVLPLRDGSWYATPAEAEPVDLNEDYTRWDLVESVPPMVPVRASVGCPFSCRYCDFIELHPRVIMRSPDSIAAEIETARRCSARMVGFVDDNVFISKKRIREISTMMIERELGVSWGGFFRVDRIDESNIEALAASGCRYGLCGIESADDGQLERMRKRCKRDEIARGIDLATRAGIDINMTFIIGYPGETRASIDNTVDFLNGLPTDRPGLASWMVYPFYLLPNTAVDALEYRRQYGLEGRRCDWKHDTMSAGEVEARWAPYMFRRVERVPYQYYNLDSPRWWSIEQRNRGFRARKQLTDAFLDRAPDGAIQAAFGRLFEVVRDGGKASEAPAWRSVLADRSVQPGARRCYRGAFE